MNAIANDKAGKRRGSVGERSNYLKYGALTTSVREAVDQTPEGGEKALQRIWEPKGLAEEACQVCSQNGHGPQCGWGSLEEMRSEK